MTVAADSNGGGAAGSVPAVCEGCGAAIVQFGRGRRRRFCETCRPSRPRKPVPWEPSPRQREFIDRMKAHYLAVDVEGGPRGVALVHTLDERGHEKVFRVSRRGAVADSDGYMAPYQSRNRSTSAGERLRQARREDAHVRFPVPEDHMHFHAVRGEYAPGYEPTGEGLSESTRHDAQDPAERLVNGDLSFDALVMPMIRELPQRAQQVLALRFGLVGKSMTLEEVGGRFGLTRERIRQIERDSLAWLRARAAGLSLGPLDDAGNEPVSKVDPMAPVVSLPRWRLLLGLLERRSNITADDAEEEIPGIIRTFHTEMQRLRKEGYRVERVAGGGRQPGRYALIREGEIPEDELKPRVPPKPKPEREEREPEPVRLVDALREIHPKLEERRAS